MSSTSLSRDCKVDWRVEKIDCPVIPEQYGMYPATVYSYSPGYTRWYEEKSLDVPGPRRQWKSFQHYKCGISSHEAFRKGLVTIDVQDIGYLHKGYIEDFYSGYSSDRFGDPGRPTKGLPVHYAKSPYGDFVPPPDDLIPLVENSLRVMLPKIRGELSLINSILELKDFASLPRTLHNLYTTGKHLLQRGNMVLRRILHSTADSYLQAEFNILPLISDITGIYQAVSRTERRMNDLISREGRIRVSHFRRVLDDGGYSEDDYELDSPAWSMQTYNDFGVVIPRTCWTSTRSRREVYTQPSVFHAQLQYNYNYTAYQREHARLLSLLDALGVNFNPAIIWNAIPWSFVVDWVVGVSRWLNDQRIGNMDPQINMLQYLWSIKRERRVGITTKLSSPIFYGYSQPTYPISMIYRPWFTETSYRRSCGLPGSSSFVTSGLSLKEFSLGAALVVCQARRLRNIKWLKRFVSP